MDPLVALVTRFRPDGRRFRIVLIDVQSADSCSLHVVPEVETTSSLLSGEVNIGVNDGIVSFASWVRRLDEEVCSLNKKERKKER